MVYPNPSVHWDYSLVSGTTVNDLGSEGLNGTLVNGPTIGHHSLISPLGIDRAVAFDNDGGSAKICTAAIASLLPLGDFSFAIYAQNYLDGNDTFMVTIGWSTTGGASEWKGFRLLVDATTGVISCGFQDGAAGPVNDVSSGVDASHFAGWLAAVYTFDSATNTAILYWKDADDKTIQSASQSFGVAPSYDAASRLAAPGWHEQFNTNFADGAVSDFKFWKGTILSPAEAAEVLGEYQVAPTAPVPANAWLSLFSTTSQLDLFAFTEFDTIRGGKQLVIYTSALQLNDPSRNAGFNSTVSLPATWSATGTGSQELTTRGTILKTSAQPGSSSGVTSSLNYNHFDVAVDVELVRPAAVRTNWPVDLAVLEFDTGLGATLLVEAQRGPEDVLQVRARATSYGRVVGGHNLIVDARRFTLRIVRNGRYAWAFYGFRDPRTQVYSELVKLLDFDQFELDPGTIEIRASNLSAYVDVQTRISNFTVESHVRLSNRLLDGKRLAFERIIADVPAATLEEVGLADITAFGLFGEAVNPGGFEYTLPPPRTVGRERTRQLKVYLDEQVRDGED